MSAQVIPILRAFNPISADAENEYDGVAHRMNQLTAVCKRRQTESTELRRQFVEDDLLAHSGSRRGEALTPRGRGRRLRQLITIEIELDKLERESANLRERLEMMNRAIESWARETYGPN